MSKCNRLQIGHLVLEFPGASLRQQIKFFLHCPLPLFSVRALYSLIIIKRRFWSMRSHISQTSDLMIGCHFARPSDFKFSGSPGAQFATFHASITNSLVRGFCLQFARFLGVARGLNPRWTNRSLRSARLDR